MSSNRGYSRYGEFRPVRVSAARHSEVWNAAPDDPAPAAMVGLGQLVQTVFRRKLLVCTAAALGMGAGLGLSLLQKPVFRARTSVQIEGVNENYFLRDAVPISPAVPNASAQNYLENQLKVLRSETLAGRVAARLRKETSETIDGDQVRRALSVEPSLLSQVVEIYFEDGDAATAAMGANVAVEEFIAMTRQARWQTMEDTAEALGRQTADLKSKLQVASQGLEQYAKRSGLVFLPGGQGTIGDDRMRQLEEAVTKAEAERVAKQSRLEAAEISAFGALPDSLVTGPLRQFQTDLETLRRQAAEARTMYTPAHYKVKRLEAQIAETLNAIAGERRAVADRLRTEYQAAAAAERRLIESHDRQLRLIQAETGKAIQYNVFKREVETTQRLYDSVLERVKAASVASALTGANVRVIDRAQKPRRPYKPSLPLGSAMGLAAGVLAGIGVGIVRGPKDRVIRAGEPCLPEVPELGVIPSARDVAELQSPRRNLLSLHGPKPHDLALATWRKDTSLFAESFRAALASIILASESPVRRARTRQGQARGRMFVVSSTEPMEGKTTVISNLALASADARRRVLLIDADLRRPRLHDIFDICNDWGLSDLIQSDDPLDSLDISKLSRPTEAPGLFVIPSGPGADGVSKMLYASRLEELLERVRREFDLILIDTPPMVLYPDARLLARLSDGIVLVVRSNRCNREYLTAYSELLSQDRTPILGTILNDCRIGSTHYRGYSNYDRYYRQ